VTLHAPLAPFKSLPRDLPRRFERWEVRHPALVRQSWQVLLMRWPPGYQTFIHDHGGAFGVEVMLEGHLLVESFEEGALGPVATGTVTLKAGHVETVDAQNHFHRCTNPASRPALSLHVYSRPLVSYAAWLEDGQEGRSVVPENPPVLARIHPGLSGVIRV
jgi:hypothetical protein